MAAITSAVLGVVGGVASAAMSFSEAEKQKDRAADAQKKQDDLMKKATAQAEIDRYSKLSVPMEAYRQKQEGSAQDVKTVMDMVTQGDQRNIASLTPGLGAQVTQGRQQTTADMGQDMFALDKMKADAKTRQDDTMIAMYTDMARDKALEKQDAEILRAQSISSGIQGVTDTISSVSETVPLFTKDKAGRKGSKLAKKYAKSKPSGMSDAQWAQELSKEEYWKYLGKEYDANSAAYLGGGAGFTWK